MNTPKSRPRDLGIKIGQLEPGPQNAITDVPGVQVGHFTINDDLHQPPIHTGVTVILPHSGNLYQEKVIAAVHTINGYGKATGFEQVREMGTLETPVALTNTLNVGIAWDALITYTLEQNAGIKDQVVSINPVVGDCNDSRLNDIQGRHVHKEHVLAALSRANSGTAEGNIGAGTGMVCYGFKGGIGTASRKVMGFTLGILVVANFGSQKQLMINGVPVGLELEKMNAEEMDPGGSIIMVIAVDAPLTDRQLGRIARRTAHGLARTGAIASNQSGDFCIAFSTAQRIVQKPASQTCNLEFLCEADLTNFFQATIESTEEAVINALFAAEPIQLSDGLILTALPVDQVLKIMKMD